MDGTSRTERLIALDGIDLILILHTICTLIVITFGWIGHLDLLSIMAGIILVGITGGLIIGIITTTVIICGGTTLE
tara:strand:+ start:419 stop:646 length:228 start_codon:yes stop_codon:yes gene_type:complete